MMSFHELNAGFADMAYDREVVSTPEGRLSLELREKAQRLNGMGQLEDALELFQQAVALFDEQDDGAAAAAARHDLGTTISDKRDGPSLATAERLLERARSSPARARVPRRISETENSLAICLRRQAKLTSGEERRKLLERAASLYRSIIWKLERSGIMGLETLANTHLNLGNLLGQELKELDKALREYERAARTAQQVKQFALDAGEEPSSSVRRAFHYAHLTPAGLLRQRGRKQDLRDAERLIKEALTWGDPQFEPLIRMEQAELCLAGTAPDRVEQAWAALVHIRQEWLPEEEHLHLADLLRRAGSPDAALERLSELIRRGISHRALNTISDFEADAASADFQEAAALAARIHVQDKQQPVEAFLVLENTSGLRFNEMLSWLSWSPQTPLTRTLHERLMRTMGRTWVLDGMARILEKLEPSEQQEMLDNMLGQVPEQITKDEDQRLILSSYSEARQAPVPSQLLQQRIEAGREEVQRLRLALKEKDKGYVAAERLLSTELDADSLSALLREEPGQVLVRLNLERDLLAVAVWLEGDTLQGRSTTVPIEGKLLALLAKDHDKVDFEQLSRLLEKLDLSAAFPPERKERAVLLPSYWAASLPLSALGPRGSRIIDHFSSIVWLPSLAPLRTRPAPSPPRSGHLVIIPETTRYHRMALLEPRPGERRLEGAAATLDAVMQSVGEVDTVCIYAHGSHRWGESPVIKLRNKETLDFDHLGKDVRGLERVENWACESGTNRPVDPLTPPADDAFGLDFKLLMQGARSAIGTLWKVPDLVTASIVRRYRQHLGEGLDAARALAEAQRWWDAEGLPRLLQCLRESPLQEAITTFSATLGFEVSPDVLESPLEMLAPAPERLAEKQLQNLAVRLACPVSWAGLRFVGLPERRPLQPWQLPEDRPLKPEESQDLEQFLKREPPTPQAFDDLQEERLARAQPLSAPHPTAPQAIEVARLMRERLHSSYRDNLLLGLAWLHQALAAPGLPAEQRARLSVEAAHLWLDVAIGEQLVPMRPAPVALARAEALLATAPCASDVEADAIAARVRLHWLRSLGLESFEEIQAHARQALAELRPALERMAAGTYESLRVAAVAVELLLFRGPGHEEAADAQLLERARHLLRASKSTLELMPAICRLRTALDAFEPDEELPGLATEFLTARELAQVMLRNIQRQPPPARGSQVLVQSFDRVLSRLEGRHWGYAGENREEMLRSVGTPGGAYRQLLATYLASHAQARPDAAAHHLACIQYACDLRVGLLHRLVRYRVRHGEWLKVFGALWDLVRVRQALHTALADAALLITMDEKHQPRPHTRDPYLLPARQLLEPMPEVMCGTAWSLGELCEVVRQDEEPSWTAAFEAAQASAGMEEAALHSWEGLIRFQHEVEQLTGREPPVPLHHILPPPLNLQTNEDELRKLPPGNGVLGLIWAPLGQQLLAMACWNDGSGVQQRTLRLDTGPLYAALQELFIPRMEDEEAQRGHSGPRRRAWETVERCMAPILEALVVLEGKPALHWSVIAPGSLRDLPLLGLRVRGRSLAEQVLSLVHLPHLGFGTSRLPSEGESEFTACLLARDRHHATTRFGEAALETLRRAHPPQLLADLHQPNTDRLMEVEALLQQTERLQTLRFYGVGGVESLNDTMALMHLEGGQPLRDRNTHELFLPRCRVVELWACTGGSAGMDRRLLDEGDRIPGLAASFLCNGAAAVLDLAWPVHDLVKALVCEQYGLLRRSQGHGPERLVIALREAGTMLRMLSGLPAGSRGRDVLTLLDELRQLSARKHGFSNVQVVAFASDSGTTALEQQDAAGLIEELCHPSHLGAFRWWGM